MTSSDKTPHYLLFFSLLLCTVAYWPGLGGDYIFDDFPNILENRRLHITQLDIGSLQSASFSSDSGIFRRPLSMLTFALNHYFSGLIPFSYKVTNLAIHLLNGVALYLLGLLLLRAEPLRNARDNPAWRWLPLLVASVWLLHPLNLTGVLYVVQRMTSLSTLFMLIGIVVYCLGRTRMLAGQRGLHLVIGGPVLFGTLALLSKESGALIVLYIACIEWAIYRFRRADGGIDARIVGLFVLTVLAPFTGVVVYLFMHPDYFVGAYAGRDFSLLERVLTQPRVLVFYLRLILLPTARDMGVFHDDIPLSQGLLAPATTLAAILCLAGLLALAIRVRKRLPLVALGVTWFFVGHALESTLLPLEIAHEHRNYLPDFGILLALLSLGFQPGVLSLDAKLRIGMSLLLLLLLALLTGLRAQQWSDNISLSLSEARNHPQSARAVTAAARIHALLALDDRSRDPAEAYRLYEQAITLDTLSIVPEISLLIFSERLGLPIRQSWLDSALHKLSHQVISQGTISSLKELVRCRAEACVQTTDAQVHDLFRAGLGNPQVEQFTYLQATLLTLYAEYHLNSLHDPATAERYFRMTIELNPYEPQYVMNLVRLLAVMRRGEEALDMLKLAEARDTHGRHSREISELKRRLPGAPPVPAGDASQANP